MYQTIRYEKQENIGIITIDRPEALNALNSTVILELIDVIGQVEQDGELRALIITGEGRSFVAGADIGEQCPMDLTAGRNWGRRGSALMRRIEKLEIPTIAAVNGFALGGGCELAMACDFRVAGKSAVFGQPEVGLGILPGAGGTQRLALLAGPAVAREMVLLGRRLRADEALTCGLVTKVVENEATLDTALALAAELCKKPAYALAQAKCAIVTGQNFGVGCGKLFERQLFALTFSNSDQVEGMHAFLERREPRFQNQR